MAKWKQRMIRSCGAAVLMCAADELGLKRWPISTLMAGSEFTSRGILGQLLAPKDGYRSRMDSMKPASDFSRITGGILSDLTEKAIYDILTGGDLNSYSMPSRIAALAHYLGFKVDIYNENGFAARLLDWIYDDLTNCETLAKENSETIVMHTNRSAPPLKFNQRAIVLITTAFIDPHYVLMRHNGEYMNPADGKDYFKFEDMGWLCSRKGVSIILSKHEPDYISRQIG